MKIWHKSGFESNSFNTHNEEVTENRKIMETNWVVILLAKHELPFRGQAWWKFIFFGKKTTTLNNFYYYRNTIVDLRNLFFAQNLFKLQHGLIQNDLISCVSKVLDDQIREDIKEASFFSIHVDETMDISATEHLSFIICYVDQNCIVQERFVVFSGYQKIEKQNS